MADELKKPSDAGVVSRLAGRGEEAITRLMDELGRNSRVTEALAKAMSAKGKVDETTRRTLNQVGLAAADEVKEVRGRLEALEKRLATLESREATPKAPAATTPGAGRRKAGTETAGRSSAATSSARRRSGPSSGEPSA